MLTTLDSVKPGARVVIERVDGRGWVSRLYSMGLLPGAQLEVIFNDGRGPVVVKLGDVEVSIGRGIARRILVKVI